MSKAAPSQAATVQPRNQNMQHTELRFGLYNLKAVQPSESLALQPFLYFQRKFPLLLKIYFLLLKQILGQVKGYCRPLPINSVSRQLVLKQKNDHHLRRTGSGQILSAALQKIKKPKTIPSAEERLRNQEHSEQQRHWDSALARDLRLM